MDSQTKSAIKQLVLDLRHTLEDELAIALRRYGLETERKWSLEAPPDRLTDAHDREIWQRIVAVVRTGMKEGRTLPQASADYVRESAFTFLNRLVGLKCLEVRGIIDEVITTRDIYGGRSKAHRDYRDEHPREARAADDALPACLEAACRRVNDELIGYLFDPDDDHSLVWPRYAVLKGCIEKINALDDATWREDEIIGWIYQFYNAEEKRAIRDRGKPQTPHDVAVINQFFTPRWIVKFLVDNTLGRLWLEMHPYSPRVREKCDCLVPELLPTPSEGGGQGEGEGYALDPDSPINNPGAPSRREWKRVTHIRLLDPACGTMHFGHYACEVFDAMYRDARDRGEVEIEDERIPGAILEYNLYGVDIDRRAVQLAALSLFMKAKTMHSQARVQQVNLVVADTTMPDSGVKKRFLARYAHDKRLQQAIAQVLDDLDQVAQVGSLLRVEERLRELLARAGHAAAKGEFEVRCQHELPGMEPGVRQMGLAEVAADDQTTAWTPHTTLQEVRDDLRAFAREALQEHDVNAQLFATEADKAVRMLDVFMSEYDVVVMNPPYGMALDPAKEILKEHYPITGFDLYTAFVERGLDLVSGDKGYLGILTSRTFIRLTQYRKFREKVLLDRGRIVALADLGWGVLDDALVEVAASVLCDRQRCLVPASLQSWFLRLVDAVNKEKALKRATQDGLPTELLFQVADEEFRHIYTAPLCYWAPRGLREEFGKLPPLHPRYATAGTGASVTRSFCRYTWEVDPPHKGRDNKWVTFANGGPFSPFYRDISLVVDWEEDGARPKKDILERYPYLKGNYGWKIQNEAFFFQEGITWGKRTEYFNAQFLPSSGVFSDEGQALFPTDKVDLWFLLAYLNSGIVRYFLLLTCGVHKHYMYVKRVPVLLPSPTLTAKLASCARDAFNLKAAWDNGDETCTRFTQPWLLQLTQAQGEALAQGLGRILELLGHAALGTPTLARPHTLTALIDRLRVIEDAADARLQALQAQIDEAVYDLYEISLAERALIERELGDQPPELVWPQMEGKSDQEKRREHVRRFFSYFALQAVRGDVDGIVPLAGSVSREATLVQRVRARLETEFGPQVAYQFEQDAAEYLGRSLEEWLHRYFFSQFHVKLYKKRPILWHLTSARGTFAVMLDYHRLTRDTLPKVQTLYLWPQMEAVRTRLAAAQAHEASLKEIADLEAELADLQDCNDRLECVIQGTVKVDLPEWAAGPYRGGKPPYDPELDDGVKVNLLPVQEAGLLPVKKVV